MIKTPEEILKEEEEKKKQGKGTQLITEDGTFADLGFVNLNNNVYNG